MSHGYVLRSMRGGKDRTRSLQLTPEGVLEVEGSQAPPRTLRVLHRAENGLVVALWGHRVVSGVVRADPQGLSIFVEGRMERLTLKPAAVDAMEQAAQKTERFAGPQAVESPIPGLIKSVCVKPGQVVRAGQTVVVLEAMKMENELAAPRAGTVQSVHAKPGQTVDAGAVLAILAT